MNGLTPDEAGARLAAIRKLIQAIDGQAATIVTKIVAGRDQLKGLAEQRQPLVDEADGIMREMLAAPWRDVLRDAGEGTVP